MSSAYPHGSEPADALLQDRDLAPALTAGCRSGSTVRRSAMRSTTVAPIGPPPSRRSVGGKNRRRSDGRNSTRTGRIGSCRCSQPRRCDDLLHTARDEPGIEPVRWAIGIAVPSLAAIRSHPDANTFAILIVALLQRGRPMTLAEVALDFEAGIVDHADDALFSLSRCRPARQRDEPCSITCCARHSPSRWHHRNGRLRAGVGRSVVTRAPTRHRPGRKGVRPDAAR